jgi:uncharacterized protein YabE (DUF348 family)
MRSSAKLVRIQNAKKSKKPTSFWARHPYLLMVIIVFSIVGFGLLAFVSLGSKTVGASDSRIVDVYVDGEQRTIPTRAGDVKTLLQRLNIELKEGDIVEPHLDTPIIEDNTQVNIYRARPIQVIEGDTIKTVLSASRSPRQVAKLAGVELLPEDGALLQQNQDIAGGSLVAEQIVIDRSLPIQMNIYGTLVSYRTRADTVGDLLAEKNIILKDGETLQPSDPQTPISPNLFIAVNQAGKQTVAVQEMIPFKSTTKNDPSVPAGQVKIQQVGQNGARAAIYEVAIVDGVEVSRKLLQEVVLLEPVQEIKLRGTQAIATYTISGDKSEILRAAGVSERDFAAVDFIFQKESTWRPGAINARGCIGLGQRCPSKGSNALAAACPNWQTDAVCQVRHFSAYANRYGGWQGAYQAWLEQGWW